MQLKRADMAAHAPEYAADAALMDEVQQVLDAVLSEKDAFSVRMLAVNGHDVMSWGVPEGRCVGNMLAWLLEEVIEERVPNERAALRAAGEARTQGGSGC